MTTRKYFNHYPLLPALFLCVIFITGGINPAQSQQMETLLHGDVRHGGFGGPVLKLGDVAGNAGIWVGGRGGWILNFSNTHAISLGGGGYGLVTEHSVPAPSDNNTDEYAAVGYGGFDMEYTNNTFRLVHFTVSSLVGAGGVTTRDRHFEEVDTHPSTFFVFEPGLNLEMNMTSFFRISAGATYRLTSGISKAGLRDSDFSGFNAQFSLKFGAF